MKVIISLLFFIYLFYFINTCPVPEFDITTFVERCDYETPQNTYGNKITIENALEYSQITITPSQQITRVSNNGVVSFQGLVLNTTYVIAASHACGPKTFAYSFSAGFSWVISNPLCVGSKGSVLFIYDSNSININEATIYKASDDNFPSQPLYNGENTITVELIGPGKSCQIKIPSYPLSLNVPKFEITHDRCSRDDPDIAMGTLKVVNYQDYTDISLLDDIRSIVDQRKEISVQRISKPKNIMAPTPVTSEFTQLASGPYHLKLTSPTCGEQEIPIYIQRSGVSLELDINATCPNKLLVTPTLFNGVEANGEWIVNNVVQNTLPLTIDNLSPTHEIQWKQNENCFVKRALYFPNVLLPISHQIVSNSYNCDDNRTGSLTIKINYHIDKSLLNLTFSETNTGESLNISSSDTINVQYGQEIIVSDSGCYANAQYYKIFYKYPTPVLIYEEEGLSIENCTLTIPNYLDFPTLSAVGYSKNIIYGVKGVFNLPRKSGFYSINYDFRDCANKTGQSGLSSEIYLTTIQSDKSPNLRVEYKFVETPTCVGGYGSVNVSIVHNVLGVLYTDSFVEIYPNSIHSFVFMYDGTYIYYDWETPSFTFSQIKPTALITNASCKYGKGEFDIQGVPQIQNRFRYYINDQSVFVPYEAGVGSYNIVIHDSLEICSNVTLNGVIGFNGNYKFNYTLEPNPDCSQSGWFRVPAGSYNSLKVFELDGGTEVPGKGSPGNYALNGGDYRVEYESSDSTCIGIEYFTIESPQNVYNINYTTTEFPSCVVEDLVEKTLTDGYFGFQILTKSSGENVPISSIYNYDLRMSGSNSVGILAGKNKIGIRTGTCQYRITLDVPISPPDFIFTQMLPYGCWINDVAGFNYKVVADNPTIQINNLQSVGGENSGTYTFTDFHYLNQFDEPNILVTWNGVCAKKYNLNVTRPDFSPNMKVTTICGDYNGVISIDNPKDYSYFVGIDSFLNSDGKIYGIIGFSNMVFPEYWTHYPSNCASESNIDLSPYSEFPLDPSTIVVNESCSGSLDASIQIQNPKSDSIYHLGLYQVSNLPEFMLGRFGSPTFEITAFTDNQFTNIKGDEYYYIYENSIANKLCVRRSDQVNAYSAEPVLMSKITQSDCDVKVETSINRIDQFKLNGTTDDSHIILNPKPGVYPITVSIDTETCRRENIVSSVKVPPISSECSSIKKDKNNAGLIAGLVVGIIGALLIGFAIAYFIKRKKGIVPEKPELIPMDTVNIFTGGKIEKLDEF